MATDYELKNALPNKLLNEDGTITDLLGNEVINPVQVYENKPALPNKWLNPDGTYSTLLEIISGIIDPELYIIVEELPASGEPNKIYLLVDGNKLIEYLWVNNEWDPIGMVEFDINNYYTKAEVTQLITTALQTAKDYTDTQLVDYVKNTDYASADKGGVVKSNSYYNAEISSASGTIFTSINTYAQYQNKDDRAFIGKGTLENVITGKELVNKTYVDNIVGDIESILEELDIGGGVE